MKKLLSLLTVYDYALALFFLAAAAMLFLSWGRAAAAPTPAAWVSVSRDGVVVAEYQLAQDICLDLEWQGHHNRLVIANGQAYIEQADCPDQYCVAQPPISSQRQSIVCLPARLVISVHGGEASQLDAVSQ